jgi:drug/metabolite transporter (DMT)-like permease
MSRWCSNQLSYVPVPCDTRGGLIKITWPSRYAIDKPASIAQLAFGFTDERRCVHNNRQANAPMPDTPVLMRPPWWAYGALAASMALVGSYVALSKPMVAALPVFLLAWLRFAIGGLAMVHWFKRPPGEAPMTPSTMRWVFLESLFGNFLFSLCMLYGMALTSAVTAGVVMASIPAACAVLSWLMLGERISARVLLAIVLAVSGIALVALTRPADGTATSVVGIALLFGAVICEALYAVIGKRLTGVLSARRITALVNAWGLALMTPFGLWAATRFDFASVTAGVWVLLVFYALAASVWTVWLWMTGLRHVEASRAGVFTVFLPIATGVVGVVFLGESIGFTQIVAYVLALAAVWFATR